MAEDPVRQQAQGLRARVGAGTHGVSKLWSRGGVGLRASSRSTQTPHHGGRTVKTSVGRLLTGVVALALLLGGFGLMQSTAQAQTVAPSHICSNDSAGCSIVKFGDHDGDGGENDMYYTGTAPDGTTTTPSADDHNNVFTFTHTEGGTLVVQNLDLPTVRHKVEAVGGDATDPDDDIDGANANPKSIAFTSGTITFVAVHRSSGLTDDGTTYQVKAFNGNTIRVSFTPTGGGTFATIKTVMVDNGKPALVATSPDPGLIVKGNVDITFSADITDSGAGFDAKYGSATAEPPTGIAADLSPDGLLTAANNTTNAGGVRLVVAGNVVELPESAFTKIDDGWRVTATINSTSLQGIATNVPWYFEVRDRANNVQRTTGSVSGTAGADSEDGTIVDSTFSGTLNTGTFLGTMIRVMKKDGATTVTSKPRAVTFVGTNGVFTIPGTSAVATALFPDAVADDEDSNTINDAGYQCRFDERDAYLADNSDLDATQPDGGVNGVADSDNNAAQLMACQPAEGDKYEILGTNLITIDSVAPTLASDNPVVTGRGYDATNKDKAQRNSIRVRFVDIGKTDSTAPGSGIDAGTVTAGAFTVSGHTVEGVQSVGNAVYLALADNLGSTEQPTVDIAGAVIMDKAGNAVSATRQKAADNQGPVLSLSESEDLSRDKVTVTITTDEQLNDTPMVYVTKAAKNGDAAIGDTAASPVSQTGALSYSYAHQQSVAGDGLYSVYVEAEDVGDTMSTVGNKGSASKPSSFTFQLDRRFNGGVSPEVTASSAENVEAALTPPKVETISPMIITVDLRRRGRGVRPGQLQEGDADVRHAEDRLLGRHVRPDEDVRPGHGSQQPGQHQVHDPTAEPQAWDLHPDSEG